MRSRAQHKCFAIGRGRNSICKNSDVKEVAEWVSFMYTLILYHPRIYNMFHVRVPPHGPTPDSYTRVPSQHLTPWSHPRIPPYGANQGSRPRVPPHGSAIGFRVLALAPGSRYPFSGMPKTDNKFKFDVHGTKLYRRVGNFWNTLSRALL